jgi:hypothetical protein
MSDTLDTPLTRLKAKYDGLLSEKDAEIAALKTERARLRGINDLLKFELASLEAVIDGIHKNMNEVTKHIAMLKVNLPNLE